MKLKRDESVDNGDYEDDFDDEHSEQSKDVSADGKPVTSQTVMQSNCPLGEDNVLFTKRKWRPLSASNMKSEMRDSFKRKQFHKRHLANKQGPFLTGTTPIPKEKGAGFDPYLRYTKEPAKVICHTHGDTKMEDTKVQCNIGPSVIIKQPCPGYHIPESMRQKIEHMMAAVEQLRQYTENQLSRPRDPLPQLPTNDIPVELLAEVKRTKLLIPDILQALEREGERAKVTTEQLQNYKKDETLLLNLQHSLDKLHHSMQNSLGGKFDDVTRTVTNNFERGLAQGFATFERNMRSELKEKATVQCSAADTAPSLARSVELFKQHSNDLSKLVLSHEEQLGKLRQETGQLAGLQQDMVALVMPKVEMLSRRSAGDMVGAPTPEAAAPERHYANEIKEIDLAVKEIRESIELLRNEVSQSNCNYEPVAQSSQVMHKVLCCSS